MKRSKFTEVQIARALRQAESGPAPAPVGGPQGMDSVHDQLAVLPLAVLGVLANVERAEWLRTWPRWAEGPATVNLIGWLEAAGARVGVLVPYGMLEGQALGATPWSLGEGERRS